MYCLTKKQKKIVKHIDIFWLRCKIIVIYLQFILVLDCYALLISVFSE